MAIAEFISGTQAIDNSNNWSMNTDTAGPDPQNDDGVYQIWLDLSDMVTGDELIIRIYEQINGADQRIFYGATLQGPQPFPVWVSPTFVFTSAWDATLFMGSATTCTVDWSIRQIT
jgi:hypothetical protein